MIAIIQDVRYALRTLGKNPGFTAAAVLTLAGGIAAAVAMFSIVDGVLLKPLPYANPDRLVSLTTRLSADAFGITSGQFITIEERSRAVQQIGAFVSFESTLTGLGLPERIRVARASGRFFSVLGVTPMLGRLLAEDDTRQQGEVALLTHRAWMSRFGGAADVVGRSLTLNGRPTTIVGVLSHAFRPPRDVFSQEEIDVWLPLRIDRAQPNWGSHVLTAVGRLAPGASVEQAQIEAQALQASIHREHPEVNPENVAVSLRVTRVLDDLLGRTKDALWLLVGAVALVLLIAATNLAGLLLIRSQTREQEVAIRAALGSGRWPVVRQLLAESVVLVGAGTAVGIQAAYGVVKALPYVTSAGIPRLDMVALDGRTLLFAVAVQGMMTLAFGLISALYLDRTDLFSALRVSARTSSSGTSRSREVLVAAQIALTVVLVIAAGLVLRSFDKIVRIDPGFESRNLLTARVSPRPPIADAAQRRSAQDAVVDFYVGLLDTVRRIPGVAGAAAVNVPPLAGRSGDTVFDIEGRAPASRSGASDPQLFQHANQRWVTPEYFRVMGIQVVRGRAFMEADRAGAPGVIIINQELADRFWPNENPIGRRMRMFWNATTTGPWLEIVGVVANTRQLAVTDAVQAEMIHPFTQAASNSGIASMSSMTLVIRTTGDPGAVVEPLRKAVTALDSAAPVHNVQTMGQAVSRSIAQPRLAAMLVAVFSCIALGLAMLGLYGVVAYAAAQRMREFGVRIALGATKSSLTRLMLRRGLRVAMIGAIAGAAAAQMFSGVLRAYLYGVTPSDAVAMAGVALVLTAAVLVATYLPARRAARVDPLVALRYE
jgi:putative ABC transport system permease protein